MHEDPIEPRSSSWARDPAHLLKLLDSTADYIGFIGDDERLEYQNQASRDVIGGADWRGKTLAELEALMGSPGWGAQVRGALRDGVHVQFEWYSPLLQRWLTQDVYPVAGGVALFGRDVTVRHEQELARQHDHQRLTHQARHDALTGLPNRIALHALIDEELARPGGPAFALHLIDLDGFKTINDTLGHAIGDLLLKQVADRLRACQGPHDTVARYGGDEFVLLQTGGVPQAEAIATSRRMIAELSRIYQIERESIMVGACIGIAFAPQHGHDADSLYRAADAAMYQAKAVGRNNLRCFDPSIQHDKHRRQALRAWMRDAIAKQELHLVFQPLITLDTGLATEFEALLRWRQPVLGDIGPDEFIPIAEESGQILAIGAWVLDQACREAATWPASFTVTVNLSPLQLVPSIVDTVAHALRQSRLAPERLKLEITETVLLENSAANLSTLHTLRAMGVRIVLDDFGIGFASLGYLQQFPFDKIKIDRSFVSELDRRRDSQSIVKAVILLADDMGMDTTAEGVETRGQLDWLRQAGCGQVQGFLLGRPMAASELPGYLLSYLAGDEPAGAQSA
jgi:diguanylate cyclase (GGDEF)-like protein